MKKVVIILLLVVNALVTKAQNNPIFNGGSADGWDKSSFTQAGSNIFTGGTADGWSFHAFQQAASNIYKGGDGDGWSFSSFQQTVNNIYVGGVGDGWSFASYLQAGNAIFKGGDGDGWSYNNFLQAGNNIFVGGEGDGWASTYRPLGPLPVTFTNFTAQKQATTSLLKWETAKEDNTAYFDVERSNDAMHFEKIGRVAAAGFSTTPLSYNFIDAQPVKGYNHYRLKQADKNNYFTYTPTRTLLFDGRVGQQINAYPVPATNLLTIEIPATLKEKDVVLNLFNSIGVMVQQVKWPGGRASDRKLIDLTKLPAGAYTLQVAAPDFSGAQTIIKQ